MDDRDQIIDAPPTMPVAIAEPPDEPERPKRLSEIGTMDEYLKTHGRTLARKAITSLNPLHVPGRDELPDFEGLLRDPFPCQQHVIAAASKMLDESGSGFLVGEMGVGKSCMGQLAINANAKGRPYRALVLCPDHLIAVWEEELRDTIPGVVIHRFDNWKGFIQFFDKGREWVKDDGKFRRRVKRWSKPKGPEWYIIGRNQAKWLPDRVAITDRQRQYGGSETYGHSAKHVVIDHEPMVDERGRPVCDRFGRQRQKALTARVFACPKCGTVIRNTKGIALSAEEIGKKVRGGGLDCLGFYLDEVPNPDHRKSGRDRRSAEGIEGKLHDGKRVATGGKSYVVRACKERLWNFGSKPYRYPPAKIIQKKLRRFFKYLVIDEVHEQKSDASAQSMAAGKLMAATKHTLALTGTLIGGYADDLFPLMVRLTPKTLREEGFEWGKSLAFSEAYGRIDRIVTMKHDGGGFGDGQRVTSMRKAGTGTKSERKQVKPGIMPTMFGRHMIGSSLFITLEELADELPDLNEFVEDGACDMDPEQALEYRRVEAALVAANLDLIRRGSMKLCGTLLATLLAYPDKPFGWVGDHEGLATVGYYDKKNDKTRENWFGVVSPADLGQAVRPKERKLIDICKAEKAEGRQSWVYVQMTGKRDVVPRLKRLLEDEGLRVGVLRSDTVDPKDRKDWIDKNGPSFDVVISHPKLVSTGLTLFSKKEGGHNFATIIFYETGYSLFDMRQAARRAWRIGQPKECRVYYLYYRDTMQHRAMQLMSRKMAAATALEGEFSTEGLVAMAGEDNAQMALARALSEKIDDADMQRSWGKVKSGTKKPLARPVDSIKVLSPDDVQADDLDLMPDTLQLLAETIIDAADDVPLPSMADFGKAADAPPTIGVSVYVPDADVEPEGDDEGDWELPPPPTRDQLAKMFRSMMAAGLSFDVDEAQELVQFPIAGEIR